MTSTPHASPLAIGRAAWLAGVLGTALLASCGGATQSEPFVAKRLLAFGDESSVIDDSGSSGNGRKYSVNATVSATDPTLLCQAFPIWTQTLATFYGLVFKECNPAGVPTPGAKSLAVPGAKVADVQTQVDAYLAANGSSFAAFDMATVLAGANDIVAAYKALDAGKTEAEVTATVETAGRALADQVNLLADRGAKVLISTVPDMGLTPYARAQALSRPGAAELLTKLSKAFNDKMRARVVNDGRRIGLIATDELIQANVRFPARYGFTNVKDPVCSITAANALPNCTALTLVTGGSATQYLWADDRHLSAGGQREFGALALARARNNPF